MKNNLSVEASVCDNHASNISNFPQVLCKYGQSSGTLFIEKDSRKCFFYDLVHVNKNFRNNLLNKKRFVFPSVDFGGFYYDIHVTLGGISWKFLHVVYNKEEHSPPRKIQAKHHSCISHSIMQQWQQPNHIFLIEMMLQVSLNFLINCRLSLTLLSLNFYFNNRFSNAVISNDKNPKFLRAMVQWFKSWENSKLPNFEEVTSTFQTFSALQRNFLCQCSLIEDLLLDSGFE